MLWRFLADLILVVHAAFVAFVILGGLAVLRWPAMAWVHLPAVVWGAAMTVNLIWPRSAVYNATAPYHWYLRWGAVLFVGIVAGGGFAYYWFVQRHRTGVLAEHQLQPSSTAAASLGTPATD